MSDINVSDLVDMDMGECIDWIIDNQHNYKLVKNEDYNNSEELVANQAEQISMLREVLELLATSGAGCANTLGDEDMIMIASALKQTGGE